MKKLIPLVLIACPIFLGGCAIQAGSASEVHSTMSFPLLFKDTVDATGIKMTTGKNGETYKAETLTHTLTISGFERNVTYKDATVKFKKDDK